MIVNIFNFILQIPSRLAPFGSWIFEKLDYINISPIEIFALGGFVIILTLHLIHLVNVVAG